MSHLPATYAAIFRFISPKKAPIRFVRDMRPDTSRTNALKEYLPKNPLSHPFVDFLFTISLISYHSENKLTKAPPVPMRTPMLSGKPYISKKRRNSLIPNINIVFIRTLIGFIHSIISLHFFQKHSETVVEP